jgi:hypothetical protein
VQSAPAREFFRARTFCDAKRPVTAALLNSLDLAALARHDAPEAMAALRARTSEDGSPKESPHGSDLAHARARH